MHDARVTAHRAILRVDLPSPATQVDGELVGLPTKRAFNDGSRAEVFALGHEGSMARLTASDSRR